jgi:hypothetical protein
VPQWKQKKRIDLPKVVADTTASELTKKAIALLLPLLLALVSALVPQVRDRILPALPKLLLAVLVGISLSLNLALLFYVLWLRKQRGRTQAELKQAQDEAGRLQDLIDNPPKFFRFGVYWDKDLTPYCPDHKDLPLGHWTRIGNRPPGYLCPRNAHLIHLQDEESLLTPVEAKQLLRSVPVGPQSESLSIKPPAGTASNDTLEKTVALIKAFRDNLPEHELGISDEIEYHALLQAAERELNCDLSEFKIPEEAVRFRPKSKIQSFDEYGELVRGEGPPTYEQYFPVAIFQRKLDGLINFLDRRRV